MTRGSAVFAVSLGLTGIFALASSLASWGRGWLFDQTDLMAVWLPWADLWLTVPLSLATAVGLTLRRPWGEDLGLVTSGAYLLGSALVAVEVAWMGPPWPWTLVLPPFAGVAIAVAFFFASPGDR